MDIVRLQELFAPVAPISFRKMFGGLGIFKNGLMFALVFDGDLYLKAPLAHEPRFVAEGCKPFIYDGLKGKSVKLGYWTMPVSAYDDPALIKRWAMPAIEAAVAGAEKKSGSSKTRASGAGKASSARNSSVARPDADAASSKDTSSRQTLPPDFPDDI